MPLKNVVIPVALLTVLYGIYSQTYFEWPQLYWASTWRDDWDRYPVSRRVWDVSDEQVWRLNEVLETPEEVDRSGRRITPGKRVEQSHNSASFRRDISIAIDRLPAAVRQLLDKELMGVHVVGNLSEDGSPYIAGMALAQYGFFRQHVGTVVLIDRMYSDMGEIERGITMGFPKRRPNQKTFIRAHVTKAGENERMVMLQYLLLHEFGHVVDYGRSITPDRDEWPDDESSEACAFACLSWASPARLADARFLEEIVSEMYEANWDHYLHSARPMLRALRQSNLETLYSASSPAEDFADSFAIYVHTVIMGRPWRLDLYIKGDKADSIESCHVDGRCPRKTAYFDRIFRREAQISARPR